MLLLNKMELCKHLVNQCVDMTMPLLKPPFLFKVFDFLYNCPGHNVYDCVRFSNILFTNLGLSLLL